MINVVPIINPKIRNNGNNCLALEGAARLWPSTAYSLGSAADNSLIEIGWLVSMLSAPVR